MIELRVIYLVLILQRSWVSRNDVKGFKLQLKGRCVSCGCKVVPCMSVSDLVGRDQPQLFDDLGREQSASLGGMFPDSNTLAEVVLRISSVQCGSGAWVRTSEQNRNIHQTVTVPVNLFPLVEIAYRPFKDVRGWGQVYLKGQCCEPAQQYYTTASKCSDAYVSDQLLNSDCVEWDVWMGNHARNASGDKIGFVKTP